ncbi:serine/threonine protein phosphatase 2A 55 kDa regulatory subunit B beta isoform-like [Malus domestica]|uniref:serine/threonine protein phosphatase 2A 55 kDa regulatory subunit B beta isoform-like n=1 Tax=Malus domestica TaxID=3750 RepID=UPI003975F17C
MNCCGEGLAARATSGAAVSPLEWKFSQVFGERTAGEEVEEVDVISAIEFDRTGDHLATGDRGGRVVLFERTDIKDHGGHRRDLERMDYSISGHPEFRYKTEFQSHEPKFDYLKSLEIVEKINKIRWCQTASGALFLLSSNDKTIKYWKVAHNKTIVQQTLSLPQYYSLFEEQEVPGSRSFFNEIIASISDIKFAKNGRHILSRDYMTLKLWDINMDSGPVATFQVHEHLRPKLCDLYENDSIFDKFECCLSGDGHRVATGSYSNLFRVFGCSEGSTEATTLEASKNPLRRQVQTPARPSRSLGNLRRVRRRCNIKGADNSGADANGNSFDFTKRLIYLAWHPSEDLIACAASNSLYMYYA